MVKKQNPLVYEITGIIYGIIGTLIGNVIYGFAVATGVFLAFKLLF